MALSILKCLKNVISRFDQLSRFIQHYSKHYFNKWILDGIQEQLRHKVQFTGSLDCNRQSIVQRGCCYV